MAISHTCILPIGEPGLSNGHDVAVRYKRKYKPSPETDALIRSAYLKQRRGDRSGLKAVSRQLGWTRDAVCKRGAELGIARVKERPWMRQEDLLERFGHLGPTGIRQQFAKVGFPCSIAAIQANMNRRRIKANLDGYSACRVADAFGTDVHKVLVWIYRCLVHAERRDSGRPLCEAAAFGGFCSGRFAGLCCAPRRSWISPESKKSGSWVSLPKADRALETPSCGS